MKSFKIGLLIFILFPILAFAEESEVLDDIDSNIEDIVSLKETESDSPIINIEENADYEDIAFENEPLDDSTIDQTDLEESIIIEDDSEINQTEEYENLPVEQQSEASAEIETEDNQNNIEEPLEDEPILDESELENTSQQKSFNDENAIDFITPVQIDSVIADINSYFKIKNQYETLKTKVNQEKTDKKQEIQEREQTAIDEINNYPWMPNELDENGEPTEAAKEFRLKNIDSIRERFKIEYNEVALSSSSDVTDLNNLQLQLNLKLDEIAKREYSYFDCSENDIKYKTEKKYYKYTDGKGSEKEGLYIIPKTDVSAYLYLKQIDLIQDEVSAEFFPFKLSENTIPDNYPFYTEGIFTAEYDSEENIFIINLKKQIFHLSFDNSIINVSETSESNIETKYEEKNVQIEESKTIEKPQDISEPKTKKKSILSIQQGRNGIYIDLSYGFGPYGNIWSSRTQIIGGADYIYAGLYACGQFHKIDSKYNSSYSTFMLYSFGAVLGTTITIWNFQPYAQIGIGASSVLIDKNMSDDMGFNINTEAGFDIHFSTKFVMGLFYKFDFYPFPTRGSTDSYGVNFGYRF